LRRGNNIIAMKRLLMVFVKNQIPGRVKTRLAAAIGEEKAFKVYKFLLEYTESVVKQVNAEVEIWYSDFVTTDDLWSVPGLKKKVQASGNLGKKMSHAFRTGFEKGYENIVVIGSDCHHLKTAHIENAFQKLKETDVVVGPSEDGGYYLIGMKRWHPGIFRDKSWSKNTLYNETLTAIDKENLSVSNLEVLNDIDTIEDLAASNIDPASI